MRIRVKIILALLIGTFCFTTYGVQAANVQASKEKMSGYGRSEKARKELKKRKKSKKADVSPPNSSAVTTTSFLKPPV